MSIIILLAGIILIILGFSKISDANKIKRDAKKLNDENAKISKYLIDKETEINKMIDEEKNLSFKIENKKQTLQEMRDSVEKENENIRNSIIEEATRKASIDLDALLTSISDYEEKQRTAQEDLSTLTKEINRYRTQARKYKSEIIGLKEYSKKYQNQDYIEIADKINSSAKFLHEDSLLNSIINLPIHSDNSKELKKLSNAVRKEINQTLENYKTRYKTKTNKALYLLMIIGLQSEMQLLLFKLTYQKLDETKELVKNILDKYLLIAGEGNQSILPTLTRFISEIEPLYMELVDIEYRYYIYRQREKEEQQALKEQMKQEAEEKRALEIERKKLEKEESKYKAEIDRNNALLSQETDQSKIEQLEQRLSELKLQLSDVENKKEEVTRLSLGKAGYVYIISNLGSFGSNTFKIGMTRRLEPQQRVDELGSASVPFKFDVHAMIFSDDAVGLENKLHKRLSATRVNKVNFRKEFFRTTVDDLEKLVNEIDPTAEFTKTMFSEEYQQTLAIEENSSLFA